MKDKTLVEHDKTKLIETKKKRVRADAQRSTDALLEAAKKVFASSGVDAPIREIADLAGVGIGTVYRNFPSRADLIAGVFRREVDACASEALVLASENTPLTALSLWLQRYTQFIATKKGLATALHSGDPAFAKLPDYFRSKFEPCLAELMSEAKAEGKIHGDIDPYDLLRAIGNLSVASDIDGLAHTQRMVDLLIKGLQHSNTSSK